MSGLETGGAGLIFGGSGGLIWRVMRFGGFRVMFGGLLTGSLGGRLS